MISTCIFCTSGNDDISKFFGLKETNFNYFSCQHRTYFFLLQALGQFQNAKICTTKCQKMVFYFLITNLLLKMFHLVILGNFLISGLCTTGLRAEKK